MQEISAAASIHSFRASSQKKCKIYEFQLIELSLSTIEKKIVSPLFLLFPLQTLLLESHRAMARSPINQLDGWKEREKVMSRFEEGSKGLLLKTPKFSCKNREAITQATRSLPKKCPRLIVYPI